MATATCALLVRNARKTHRFISSRIINQCQSPIPPSPAVLENRNISPLRSLRTASTFSLQTQPKYEDARSSYRRQNSQRGGGKSKSFRLGPWWVWLLICGIYYYPYVVAWTGAKIAFIETVRAFRKAVREGHPFTFRSFICFMATEVGRVRTTLESEQWVYRIQPFNQMQLRLLEEISKAFEAMEDKATAGTVFHFGPLKLCRVEVSYRGFLMVEFQRKAAIGGTFNLTNHDGKNVTEKDFLGKWTMVCFGLTPYPDDLQKLAAAVDKIKENAGFEIVPIYISNDPVRDTVGPLHKHVKEFHPNVISLTGSLEEIKKVAHVYGVDHMIKTEEDSTFFDVVRFVHSVLFNRYIRLDLKFRFETSTVMCLMGPNRDYVRFFWMDSDAESLADAAIKVIEFKSKKKTVCWI